MIKTLYIFVFFISITVFSQKTINIKFDRQAVIKIMSATQEDNSVITYKYNTVIADVKTIDGKFSIVLIDFNKNAIFNDYYIQKHKKRSDLIYFTHYKNNNLQTYYWNNRNLKINYPLAINGSTYKIYNLKREDDIYTATLQKEQVDFEEIVKNENGAIIDSLPKLFIKEKKINYNLRKLLDTGKYSYIALYDGEMGYVDFSKDYEKLRSLEKYHLNVYRVGINKGNKLITDTGQRYNSKDLHFIDYNNKKDCIRIGYNNTTPTGILFNDKGKVIKFNFSVEELGLFLKSKVKH